MALTENQRNALEGRRRNIQLKISVLRERERLLSRLLDGQYVTDAEETELKRLAANLTAD